MHKKSSRSIALAPLTFFTASFTASLGGCALAEEEPPLELAQPGAVVASAAALSASSATSAPSPGAAGIGDPLYPTLGNGGYVVDHYDLGLRYATASPSQPLAGTVTIAARATEALSRFNLDFAGDSVGKVTVNGRAAAVRWEGEELVITPAAPIANGASFLVVVQSFAATPRVSDPSVLLGAPFFSGTSASGWALQPHNAHTVFPCNDHPSDKASFSFHIDTPAGAGVIANGEQLAKVTAFGRTFTFFTQLQPMATELATVAVGDLTFIDRGTHGGVRIRDAVATPLAAAIGPKLAVEIEQIEWLVEQLGPYPFTSYGSLVLDAELGFALEDQSLSLYDSRFFDVEEGDEAFYQTLMVHELAHQWFGDSVAPARWSDVWLNEGHATWYELASAMPLDSAESVSLFRTVYEYGDLFRQFFGPVAAPPSGVPEELFNQNVYYGGALVLFALRQEVGDATFRRIEREWVTRFRGKSASSQDFIALSSELAGRDLTAFLTEWLYGTTTPAMPGHPDWTADPVPTGFFAGASDLSALVDLSRFPLHHGRPAPRATSARGAIHRHHR